MANLVERRSFNLMSIFDGLGEHLNTGDPVVREWFLVKSNFWPISLCLTYLLFVKVIGPSIMRDRKPFELRKTMMVYNLFLVAVYTASVSTVFYCMRQVPTSVLCKNTVVQMSNCTFTLPSPSVSPISPPECMVYAMAACGWVIYLLKYIEFLDTIFFVLRKKDKLITNLHVIHHFVLPLCGWVFFRTERSGFQAYPIIINSVVHIAMYSYYGLAAVGPSVRKYLWWKRYLTIAQMIQFILILFFVMVVMPVSGCTAAKSSIYINVVAAILFFILFYNFYQTSFKPTKPQTNGVSNISENGTKSENGSSHMNVANGEFASSSHSKVKCN